MHVNANEEKTLCFYLCWVSAFSTNPSEYILLTVNPHSEPWFFSASKVLFPRPTILRRAKWAYSWRLWKEHRVVNRGSFVKYCSKLHRRQSHKSQFAPVAKRIYWDVSTSRCTVMHRAYISYCHFHVLYLPPSLSSLTRHLLSHTHCHILRKTHLCCFFPLFSKHLFFFHPPLIALLIFFSFSVALIPSHSSPAPSLDNLFVATEWGW